MTTETELDPLAQEQMLQDAVERRRKIEEEYCPHDWFWIVGGDTSRAYSSAARGYVTTWDAERVGRASNEDDLWDALSQVYPDGLPEDQKHRIPVEAWRFHAMLDVSGLTADLETALGSLPQPKQAAARARLKHSPTYDRSDPLVSELAAAIGITDKQLDDLWRGAHKLG